eukprot:sb/3477405/
MTFSVVPLHFTTPSLRVFLGLHLAFPIMPDSMGRSIANTDLSDRDCSLQPETIATCLVVWALLGMADTIVEAIITVTSSDFYETSPMLRGGNRGSNTAEFKSEQCLVR